MTGRGRLLVTGATGMIGGHVVRRALRAGYAVRAMVRGLEQLVAAAQRAGRLLRWVQISSLGVYPPRHHYGTDETVPPSRSSRRGYPQSKIEAEAVLDAAIRRDGFPAVILRPGFTCGAGDRHILPRIIQGLQSGRMRIVGDGGNLLLNRDPASISAKICRRMTKNRVVDASFIRNGANHAMPRNRF